MESSNLGDCWLQRGDQVRVTLKDDHTLPGGVGRISRCLEGDLFEVSCGVVKGLYFGQELELEVSVGSEAKGIVV